MSVPILILAGGQSSRMGSRNKLLEEVNGQPLLRLQAWRALKASPDVSVLIRPGQPILKQVLQGLNVRVITAPEAYEGMGGSIRAGTRAHLGCACFLVLLADLVEIEASDICTVIQARNEGSGPWIWRGATQDGKPGHPILFEQNVYADLLKLRQDRGGQDVMKAHKDRVRLVPLPGIRARRDLDTVEDWDAWRAQHPANSH